MPAHFYRKCVQPLSSCSPRPPPGSPTTQAVIYAATCDWSADLRKRKDGAPLLPSEDLRYYARGVFTWPQVGTGGVHVFVCRRGVMETVCVNVLWAGGRSYGVLAYRTCVLRLAEVRLLSSSDIGACLPACCSSEQFAASSEVCSPASPHCLLQLLCPCHQLAAYQTSKGCLPACCSGYQAATQVLPLTSLLVPYCCACACAWCVCCCVQLCNDWALGGKGLKKVQGDLWGLSTVVLSFLDWPLRR